MRGQRHTCAQVSLQLAKDSPPDGSDVAGIVRNMLAEPAGHRLGIAQHCAWKLAISEEQRQPHMAPQVMIPKKVLHAYR